MARNLSDIYDVGSRIGRVLGNYNTIEAFLLLNAACVCLLGVLYSTVRPVDDYYETSRKSITINLMLLLVAGITYFAAVFIVDISIQWNDKRIARADAASAAAKKVKKKRASLGAPSGMDILKDAPNVAESSTTTNPLFLRDGNMKTDGLAQMVRAQVEPPAQDIWTLIRDHYGSMTAQVGELTSQLNSQRAEVQRLTDMIKDAGMHHLLVDGSAAKPEVKTPRPRAVVRRAFGPTRGGDGEDGTESEASPSGTRARRDSSVGPSPRSVSGAGNKAVSLSSVRRAMNLKAKQAGEKQATSVIVDGDDDGAEEEPRTE